MAIREMRDLLGDEPRCTNSVLYFCRQRFLSEDCLGEMVVRPTRRAMWYGFYVLIWLVGSVVIGIPVLAGIGGVLGQLGLGARLIFYVMPPVLSAMLVLGVLQIIAMYRYWFGSH